MTNLAHWHDDIDGLVGDFDGSLSGLCIMSLSFDFTRNGAGTHLGSSREINSVQAGTNHQTPTGLLGSAASSGNKSINYNSINMNQDAHNDNSNCFKRFKTSISNDNTYDDENIKSSSSQNKIDRQLQQLKNCLGATPLNNNHNNAMLPIHYSNAPIESQGGSNGGAGGEAPDTNRLSPQTSETSCNRPSNPATPSDSSRSSTVGARSPSPSQSFSSISTHSGASSRSQSPSDMLAHGSSGNNNNSNYDVRNNTHTNSSNHIGAGVRHGSTQQESKSANDNQQISIYSVKDSLLNGSTLKESLYTTSVITTTAPMHFKNLHHPFSLKQFPLSPHHQFSNSSLNHDLYDRYLSHDSHQPLQTPLIGIERTQDLLSLKLPPHGPDDLDSQRLCKDWPFDDTKQEVGQAKSSNNNGNEKTSHREENQVNNLSPGGNQESVKRKESGGRGSIELQKGFPFNYKSNSSAKSNDKSDQHAPMDLNVSYGGCCDNDDGDDKDDIFNESMKHFNPDRVQQNACYDSRQKNDSPNQANSQGNEGEGVANLAQYHGQESMFGIDPSKQKFQYVLGAPISVATKLVEDTITYLNQGQAYEIKLENMTDVAEAKKGFMCSIINIGFHERHMQQAENELWQQWSQQHPNEKIFSVDMKLSYNVFGVDSDGLNKYEFLWDSSKAAGVFIRINSISTEFTPKKHGGEKGVPFKLSIETFSYNSKTHDSYFISAACCQIKVFKPKGAERKIRSDRDKISKRPPVEQDKYHRSCDHTIFKECSLTSLHPMADGSLCYYRHSHGHFASKQVVTTNSLGGTPSVQAHQTTNHQSGEEVDHGNNASQQQPQDQSPDTQPNEQNSTSQANNDSETSNNGQGSTHQRDYTNLGSRNISLTGKNHQPDYPASRFMQHSQYNRSNLDNSDQNDHAYGPQHNQHASTDHSFNHSSDLLHLPQPSAFNQMYHSNHVRSVASLAGINNSQHFGIPYYGHTLPAAIHPPHIPPPSSYGVVPTSTTMAHPNHNFTTPTTQQHVGGPKGAPSIYRQLNHEKQIGANPPSHGSSFKGTNHSSSTSHNNFQTYLGNHGGSEQCVDTPSHDQKDATLSHNGHYVNETYDSHLHHSFHSTSSLNQQQPFRQRSASTSLATTANNGHCTGYMNHGNSGRHLDSYINHSGALLENAGNSGHWTIHGPSNHSQAGISPGSTCASRGNSTAIPQSHDNNNTYGGGNNYDCNNHSYDSDQNSPQKNHHQNTTDSSSSCCSRFRNNSSNLHVSSGRQDDFGLAKGTLHSQQITVNSDCTEVVSWFVENRFGPFTKTFNNYSGSDMLRLSKTELIEICGLIDGIRLFNSLHNRPIKPKRVLYICHKNNEIFYPIYLYEVALKELLRELSLMFTSQLPNNESRLTEEKHQKTAREKSTLNSSSGTDSRSSLSTETVVSEEVYHQGDNFFNDIGMQRRQGKCHMSTLKSTNESNNTPQPASIDRLLIEGLTSVKIMATEQVVQMLEDESAWTLSFSSGSSAHIEACLTASSSKRASK